MDSLKFSVSKFSEEMPGIFIEQLETNNLLNGVDTIYQSLREEDITMDIKHNNLKNMNVTMF